VRLMLTAVHAEVCCKPCAFVDTGYSPSQRVKADAGKVFASSSPFIKWIHQNALGQSAGMGISTARGPQTHYAPSGLVPDHAVNGLNTSF
jgi:hypothetical protein